MAENLTVSAGSKTLKIFMPWEGSDRSAQCGEFHFVAPSTLFGFAKESAHFDSVDCAGSQVGQRKRLRIGGNEMLFVTVDANLPRGFAAGCRPVQLCRSGRDGASGKVLTCNNGKCDFHIIQIPAVGIVTLILEGELDGMSLVSSDVNGVAHPVFCYHGGR